jgi:bilirubin oxidase
MSTESPAVQPEPDGPGPLRISRRTALLGLGGLAMVGVGGWWITDGIPRNEGSSFSSPLAIPPLIPSERVGDERVFRLSAQQGATELVPGVSFATMGFNGAYLGPTIRATRGERVRMHVTNRMELPTTAHWHGMILPASQDGTPHQTIIPGATWTAAWRIDQPAATLWYHPHPHGQTELQVGRGLAGLFLVDDPATEARLPAEYGVDDIPLILQDVTVVPGGSQVGTPTQSPIGRIGNTVVVNGTHHARFSATTTLVRFRILNASTARCYNLELSTADPFLLVGTDGGLLATPRSLKSLLLSPAERAEILVRVPKGADIVLRSAPYDLGMSAGDNIDSGAEDHLDILRITGASARGQGHAVPRSLPAVAPPSLTDVVVDRHFTLGDTTINGRTMDMDRIDTVVAAGAVERWTVTNTSSRAHNFHIHGSQFHVHSMNARPPQAKDSGRKDTVFIAPRAVAELIVPFSRYVDGMTPYMYHCHLLWHEDQGMMAQYVITAEGSEPPMSMGPDAGHHH